VSRHALATVNPAAQSLGNRPDDVDSLPAPLRELAHEFGWSVVRAFLDHGVRSPAAIRHLIHTAWLGPREAANVRIGGRGHRGLQVLDQFLMRSGCAVNARALVRLFRQQGLVLMNRDPSPPMIETSGVRAERLRQAIREEEHRLWPFLENN
jgi:hypothetical protein